MDSKPAMQATQSAPNRTGARSRRKLCLLIALVIALVGLGMWLPITPSVKAATFTVATCNDTSLRTAINNAASGDTVNFSCNGTIILSSTLNITKNLTLDGVGQSVSLSGNDTVEVLNVTTNTNFRLANLTITHGQSPVSNCSNGSCGGGIYNKGTLTVTNASFRFNNASDRGGAIYNVSGGIISSLANSTFVSNGAILGGAIYNESNGAIVLANSTFVSNGAYIGGAIYNESNGAISVANSTFVSNSVTLNSTGGAIYSFGTVSLKNSLFVKGSGGENCAGTISEQGYNLSDDNSCPGTGTSRNNVSNLNLDPTGLKNNGGPTQTVALLLESAARSFVAIGCPTIDQRGVARPAANCAVGAYEPTPTITNLTSASNPSFIKQSITFTASLNSAAASGTVTFTDGNTLLAVVPVTNGTAIFSISSLNPGSHDILAIYSGDNSFSSSNSSLTQQVNYYTYYLPLIANNAATTVGQTTTFVTFQNLSTSDPATISVQYYGLTNGTPGNTDSVTLPPKSQKAILPNLEAGSSGGGIITSSQPLNVVVSEAINSGGSAYNVTGQTASRLYSPLALNGAFGGFTTNIIIFNASNSTSFGTVQFYDANGNVAATQAFGINSHASGLLSQAGVSGLSSNQSYWAKISTVNTSDSLTAQVIEFGPNNFVATFNASVPNQAAATLYAPAAFNGLYGYVTGMGFANPNPTATTVTVTYYDTSGNPVGSQPVPIAANGNASLFQGAAGTSVRMASAVIKSIQPIVMTVNESGPNQASGTYVGIASGSQSVALPVMANGYAGFVTGTTIFNAGIGAATLTLTYLDGNGQAVGDFQTTTLAPNASYGLYQGAASQGLASNYFGTALITSNQPLIVTTNALQIGTGLFYTYTEPSN